MLFYKKHIFPGLLSVLAIICLIASCKKKDPNEGLDSPRLFMPDGISIKTDASTAKITWSQPLLSEGLPLNFTTEFSQDSTFATTEFSIDTDTLGVVVTDEQVQIRKKYFARIKANAYNDHPESKWIVSKGFSIIGEQRFKPLRDVEIKETSVTFRWIATEGLTKIVLTPFEGTSTDYELTSSDLSATFKTLTGLSSAVSYTAELFSGTKSRGFLKFTTQEPTVYTMILNPGDDLAAAILSAPNNAIIGLNPGEYNPKKSGFTFQNKTLTLKSTSGDPSDTRVLFKELTVVGDGAGLNLSGIEFDGTGTGYFINLSGSAAVFTNINIDNCVIHDATTSFFRADRDNYTMDKIIINNSIIYDVSTALSYICFHLDKLQFNSMTVSKSTFYNVGQSLVSASKVVPVMPTITFDYCTFNNFGANDRFVLINADKNPMKFNLTNSILANVPLPSKTANLVAISMNGAGSAITFNNNNTFNFTNGKGADLTLPASGVTQIGNQTIDLGWTSSTTDFTLPENSLLRTVSNVGTAIGDPRWTY